MSQTLQEGFEKFVIKKDGCWDWSGCCPKNPGYPQFRSKMKLHRAHRASWQIHFGKIPDGMFVCHHCDNRRCSNPEHLFISSCLGNNKDMMNKGRSSILGKSGHENPNAKLSEEQIEKIKIELSKRQGLTKAEIQRKGMSQKNLGKIFGVSQGAISLINIKRTREFCVGGDH